MAENVQWRNESYIVFGTIIFLIFCQVAVMSSSRLHPWPHTVWVNFIALSVFTTEQTDDVSRNRSSVDLGVSSAGA